MVDERAGKQHRKAVSPSRVPGSAHLRFDREVKGVGRLQGSSGTSNLHEYHARNALLTKLIRACAFDVLRDFKAGRLTIRDLVAADRMGRLLQVASEQKLAKPLAEAVEAWLPFSAAEPVSRRRYATSWAALKAKGVPKFIRADATIRDLESVEWRKLFRVWDASGSDWNRMRAMVSAFLTHITGHRHTPFRLSVINKDIFPLARESRGRVPDVSVKVFWKLVHKTPAHAKAAYVAFAALGCGQKEFDNVKPADLNAGRHEVRLCSKKGPDRDRIVSVQPWLWPWIERAFTNPLAEKWRRTYFNRARLKVGQPTLTMYDLRHLGAQLAVDAGVSLRDVGTHLGHSDIKTTMRYARRGQSKAAGVAIGKALKAGK